LNQFDPAFSVQQIDLFASNFLTRQMDLDQNIITPHIDSRFDKTIKNLRLN